jgi:hypothetical protein
MLSGQNSVTLKLLQCQFQFSYLSIINISIVQLLLVGSEMWIIAVQETLTIYES